MNGYEVIKSKSNYRDKNFIDFEENIDAGSGYGNSLYEEDIKSIVTREKFEQMKYIVEE